MNSKKTLLWLVLGALALAAIGGGVTFIVLTMQQREVERELRLTRNYVDMKDFEKADKLLASIKDRSRGDEPWFGQVLLMTLDVEKARGDYKAAERTAKDILDPNRKFSEESRLKAHAFLGQYALDIPDQEQAKAHFDEVLKLSGGKGDMAGIAQLGMIRMEMAAVGVNPELHERVGKLMAEYKDSPIKDEVEYVLGQVNQALLFSPNQTEGDVMHEIKKGDSMWKISREYKVPQEMIMRVNNIKNVSALKVGRRIKIPQVEFSIVVDKAKNTLTLNNHGAFFKKYAIRTGKMDFQTPTGDYKITTKRENKPGKPGGPEADVMKDQGSRWLGLQGSGVGIHGGVPPEALGTYSSTGSIGMTEDDAKELYDLAPIGTSVKIIGQAAAKTQKS